MTKEEGQSPVVMLNSFQHLIRFSLPLADTPFIPVHRTGFSGAISNKTIPKGICKELRNFKAKFMTLSAVILGKLMNVMASNTF
jgi:hypothetical protein